MDINKPVDDKPTPPPSDTPPPSSDSSPKESESARHDSESSNKETEHNAPETEHDASLKPPVSVASDHSHPGSPAQPKSNSMMVVGMIIGFIIFAALGFFAGRMTAPQAATVVPTAAPQQTVNQQQTPPTAAPQQNTPQSSAGGQLQGTPAAGTPAQNVIPTVAPKN